MFLTNAEQRLPLLDDDVFRCPGEQQPISKAVHLGRLAAGYAACEQCAWRFETDQTTTTSAATAEARTVEGIRRTRYGVRGTYLNVLDRQTAAQLTTVITTHFQRTQTDHRSSVAIGYGSHHGAPDLFAGVVSAALQNGQDVIDAGHCSAASLHHCLRTHPTAGYGLLVTGTGETGPGEIGIDIIARDGHAVAIPWADFGLSVVSSRGFVEDDPVSILQLPENLARAVPRAQRQSGALSAITLETHYRDWLRRWWPTTLTTSVVVVAPREWDSLRISWVQELTGGQTRQSHSAMVSSSSRQADQTFAMTVCADDRRVSAVSGRGRQIPLTELADWINGAHRTTGHHVTAHASNEENRMWLCDIAAPHSADSQEIICDGLAIAGLIASLAQNNSLPR